MGQIRAWNDPAALSHFSAAVRGETKLSAGRNPERGRSVRGRTSSSFWDQFVGRSLARLLCFIAGGIVHCMPLSRTQDPTADLFSGAGAQEPCRSPAPQASAPSTAVVSPADKSSPKYVLPRDLSNALQQLSDVELDGLLAAIQHEMRRRGRRATSVPEIQPVTRMGAGERASEASIEEPSEPRQLDEPKVALTQGQVNAVRATFKAGITPSRIARQFGISQSDVRKVLASEFRAPGRGR